MGIMVKILPLSIRCNSFVFRFLRPFSTYLYNLAIKKCSTKFFTFSQQNPVYQLCLTLMDLFLYFSTIISTQVNVINVIECISISFKLKYKLLFQCLIDSSRQSYIFLYLTYIKVILNDNL